MAVADDYEYTLVIDGLPGFTGPTLEQTLAVGEKYVPADCRMAILGESRAAGLVRTWHFDADSGLWHAIA